MQQLIVIEGPTASGKTALGVALAAQLNTVVISADSRQFYREVSIGTAKPSSEEMKHIPHYFVDSHSLAEPISAGKFEQLAMELITSELKDFPYLVVVGGSGMFIDALCNGLDPIPTDPSIQNTIRLEHEKQGIEPFLVELQERDPEYYSQVDLSNDMRILRAIEVIRITGKPYSELRTKQKQQRPFQVQRFVIEHPREQLYDRINHRVDQMVHAGLKEEVIAVRDFQHSPTLQTVGYSEVFDFIAGKYPSWEACIEKIKQHTRNYAKRQLTWFRKHKDAHWIHYEDTEKMAGIILQIIRNQDAKNLE
jgi:tRNA dimethylallyltransferase